MPRRNSARRSAGKRPPSAGFGSGAEHVFGTRWEDQGPPEADSERFAVRSIPGERATKVYRCPGCDQTIAIGIAHVVVWPLDGLGGVDDRRHWHRGCWSGRSTRRITRRWS